MRMTRLFLLGAALLALTPGSAGAQDKRIRLNVGGGPTFNTGQLNERFGHGWGPAIGVSFVTTHRVEIQFEYAYRYFGSDQYTSTRVGQLSGNHQTHQLDFNFLAYLTRKESSVHVYVVAGGGAYYRKVDITSTLARATFATRTGMSAATTRLRASSHRAAAGTPGLTSAAASGFRSRATMPSSTSSHASTTCGALRSERSTPRSEQSPAAPRTVRTCR